MASLRPFPSILYANISSATTGDTRNIDTFDGVDNASIQVCAFAIGASMHADIDIVDSTTDSSGPFGSVDSEPGYRSGDRCGICKLDNNLRHNIRGRLDSCTNPSDGRCHAGRRALPARLPRLKQNRNRERPRQRSRLFFEK